MTEPAPDLPRPIVLLVRWGSPALMVSLLMRLWVIFASGNYDWDMDHEMYFGQRLLGGDLIWTKEFHDKLPFVQMLFSVPAAFDSIQAWRILSLFSVTLGAALIVILVPRILHIPNVAYSDVRRLSLFAALLYASLTASLPGDLTHINPMAGAFALSATLLMLWAGQMPVTRIRVIFAAGLLAAAAISIRPYLLAPLVLTALLGCFAPISGPHPRRLSERLALFGCLGVVTLVSGLVLNLLPYALSGHMAAFWAGLSMLAQDINPQYFGDTFLDSLNLSNPLVIPFWAISLAGIAVFATGVRRGSISARFILMILIAQCSLFAFVAQKHWWPHYLNFFTGYSCLMMLGILVWLAERRVRFPVTGMLVMSLGLAGLVALATLWSARSLIRFTPAKHTYHPGPVIDAFQTYREASDAASIPFLSPSQIALHWNLKEPRHGFPHAANTEHINRGWWADVPPNKVFATPESPEAYCAFLQMQAPRLVVDISTSPVLPCLEQEGSRYRLDANVPIAGRSATLVVFRRM
ncbi:hypothetical protein [Roseovarius dicentrarchi]|uniref:hypothetical protein n=1 Tax=Roseovarius dicentrarchi TaxID=2250573 RepID=UPI000DEB4206|nr:hypothetical protein [Roseovarius dicentrarchi]